MGLRASSRSAAWWVALGLSTAGCGASAPLAAAVDKVPDAVMPDADAETIALDKTNTKVEVDVYAMTSHTVHFAATGTLIVSPKHLLASSVDLVIDTTTADASLGVVADVAKSDDFLAVDQFPTARFTSKSLTTPQPLDTAKPGAVDLFGELSLRGTTRTLRVPAEVEILPCAVNVSTEFTLNRHEYHVDSSNSVDGMVGDNVVVRIGVHAGRRCEAAKPS